MAQAAIDVRSTVDPQFLCNEGFVHSLPTLSQGNSTGGWLISCGLSHKYHEVLLTGFRNAASRQRYEVAPLRASRDKLGS